VFEVSCAELSKNPLLSRWRRGWDSNYRTVLSRLKLLFLQTSTNAKIDRFAERRYTAGTLSRKVGRLLGLIYLWREPSMRMSTIVRRSAPSPAERSCEDTDEGANEVVWFSV